MVLSGFLSQGHYTWVHKFLQTLEMMYKGQDANHIDFALPAFHDQDCPVEPFEAMSYAEALFYLRQYDSTLECGLFSIDFRYFQL